MSELGFLIMMITLHFTTSDTSEDRYFCPNYRPQTNVATEFVEGFWTVLEVIIHEESFSEAPNRFSPSKTCPTFKIDQETDGSLTIVNDLGNRSSIYFYASTSSKDPALWMVSGPHKEPVLDQSARVINSNVQVLRVVKNNVLLTFCTKQPNSETEVYSFLLARGPDLTPDPEIIENIHIMLQRRSLFLVHTARCTCKTTDLETCKMGSSASKIMSLLYLQIAIIVIYTFFWLKLL